LFSQDTAINAGGSSAYAQRTGSKGKGDEVLGQVYSVYNRKEAEMGGRRGMGQSASQPTLMNQKHLQGTQSSFGMLAASQTSQFYKQGAPPAPSASGLDILDQHQQLIQKVKQDLRETSDMIFSKRNGRFIEKPEPLAVQKLLYPSKFRKDPYLKRTQQSMGETKLPSIYNSRTKPSGQMLSQMIGLNLNKNMARNVSESALKLVRALDRAEDKHGL
jgi:hypothetical protein